MTYNEVDATLTLREAHTKVDVQECSICALYKDLLRGSMNCIEHEIHTVSYHGPYSFCIIL